MKEEELQIIDLDQNNINRIAPHVPKFQVAFIAFLAPWCGHCKSFKPEWEKTKKHLKLKRKKMKGHIITASDTTMKHLPIKQPNGFPTMSLYKSGKHVEDYTGGRNMKEVVAFIEKHMEKRDERQQYGGFSPALDLGLRRRSVERINTRRKRTRFGRRTRNSYNPKLSKIAEGRRQTRKQKKRRRSRLRKRRKKRGNKRRKKRTRR